MASSDEAASVDAEAQLVALVQQSGDPAAFSRLVRPYVAPIRAYLARLTTPGDADDLTQETLLTAWRRLSGYDGRGRLKAWLFSIAHREFLQHARARGRLRRALSRVANEPQARSFSGDAPAASSDLARVLGTLDAETRALLLLSKGVGLSHAEIADVVDKPLGTVKSTLSRAIRRLVDEFA